MKSFTLLANLLALSNAATGSPTDGGERTPGQPLQRHGDHTKRLLVDFMTIPIEVTGDHAFIAPDFSNGDQRGPCPGLNALANHGYIRRDGVASLFDVASAINSVFGMGLDLAGILSTMGTVFVGNPLSLSPGFSIGGTDPGAQNLLGNVLGLLGTPRGLEGSHNIIESDASNTRADMYSTGDAITLDTGLFEALHDTFPSGEDVSSFDIFASHATKRFKQSVATNPDFYYGPFTGFIASNAGSFFPARLFANYSKEHPDGVMNQEILKSFYGVEGDSGNLTYNKGHERIPENWYRIPVDYGVVSFNLDLVNLLTKYPERMSLGGNTGSVNSFVGLDLSDVTGGVLNSTNLLENNNLLCFVFEVVKTAAPNILSNLFATVAEPLEILTNSIGVGLLNISCPAFKDLTVGGKSLLAGLQAQFPGAKKSGQIL